MSSLNALGRVLRGLGLRARHVVAGGMLGLGLGGASPALADPPPGDVPPSWIAYAGHVRARIEQVLSADETGAAGRADWSVVARVWVDQNGMVSGFALREPADAVLARGLQGLLLGQPVGAPPPAGLRLPIVLRLDRTAPRD
ncbi:hypothetical protein [Paludibacterium paludis]|uniref:Uncharacterized protein n=1 Tax=Paludibacterium paludis TaxID=1225769 RepID=A0A918NXS7_9NEIS|nr:hypothetical protein [Paludibacterium paludis]GGY04451.1 hypothetical protein GCM10011289_03700 [Paludibacterium paludis]